MATDIEILARQITNQVLTIDAGAGYTIGDLTNNDASGSIYQSWYNICTPLVPWINTHGSGSTGSGSVVWGNISGSINNQLDLIALLNTKQNSLGFTPENISNKSTSTSLGTSNALYPTQNAVKTYVDNNISASSSITTASNLGTGEGTIYKTKVGNDLQFKSLKAGSNIILTNNPDEILITAVSGGVMATGSAIWGQIIGSLQSQVDLYAELVSLSGSIVNRELLTNKSINTSLGTSNTLYPSQNAVKVYVDNSISASSSITTASNLGTGLGIYEQKVENDLQFKSLIAGNNITLSSSSVGITINSTASGSVSGSVIGAQNIGDGEGDVYSSISGSVIQLKTIKAGDDIAVVDTEDTVEIHKLKENILNRLLTVSSSSTFSSSSTLYTNVADLTSTSAVMIYTTGGYPIYYGKVTLCAVESGSIITGPEYTFASGSNIVTVTACKVTDTSLMVSYNDEGNGKLKILDFNGLTITEMGAAYSIGANARNGIIGRISDNKCVLVYIDSSTSPTTQIIGKVVTTTVSKVINFSEEFTYAAYNPLAIYLDIDPYTYGRFSLSYRVYADPYEGNVVLGKVIENSIIFYPHFTVNDPQFGISAQTMLNHSEAILMWDNSYNRTVWSTILKIKDNIITSGSVVAAGTMSSAGLRTIAVRNLSTNTFISTYVTYEGLTKFNIGVLQDSLPVFNTTRILTNNSLGSGISLFEQDRAIVVYRDGTSPQMGKYVLVEYSIQDVKYIQNIGTGTGQVFKLTDNNIAYLKTLSAGSGIAITNNLDEIVISSSSSFSYTPENISNKSTNTNLGTSNILYPTQNAVKVYIDSLIVSSGSITSASNLGSGEGIYASKSVNDLQFKSIKAGSNIILSSDNNEITINSTSSSNTLPVGGGIGQVITKNGVADYLAGWEYPPGMLIHTTKSNLTVDGTETHNSYFNVNLSTSSVFSLTGLTTRYPYTFLINNVSTSSITVDYPQEYVIDLAPADNFSISATYSREAEVIYDGVKRIWRIGDELREVTKSTAILLFAGGGFTSPTSYLAVIDKNTKTINSGWPSFDGAVNVVTQDGNTLYVGGQFIESPGSHFVVIDKVTKNTRSGYPSFDADVYNILQDSSNLYIGGNFTSPGSYFTVLNKTTKATGSGWPSFNDSVFHIAQDAFNLYIGGNFTSPNSYFAVLNKITKLTDSGWPLFSNTVNRVAVDDNYVYVSTYIAASGSYFHVIDKATKQISTGWPIVNSNIVGIYVDERYLYIGGQFTSPGSYFAVIDKTTKATGSGWPSFNTQVSSILVDSSTVYVGGVFTSPTTRFIAIDKTTKATGSGWPSFSGDLENIMFIG